MALLALSPPDWEGTILTMHRVALPRADDLRPEPIPNLVVALSAAGRMGADTISKFCPASRMTPGGDARFWLR